MIPPALLTMGSSVLGKSGGLGGALGGGGGGAADSVRIDTGPIEQSIGGGGMIQHEATDSWIWLVVFALLVVALFKWR